MPQGHALAGDRFIVLFEDAGGEPRFTRRPDQRAGRLLLQDAQRLLGARLAGRASLRCWRLVVPLHVYFATFIGATNFITEENFT